MRARGYKLIVITLGIIIIYVYSSNYPSITNYAIINNSLNNLSEKYTSLNNSFNNLKIMYDKLNDTYNSLINNSIIITQETNNTIDIITRTEMGETITYNEDIKNAFNITATGYQEYDWQSITYAYVNITVKNVGVRQVTFNFSRIFPQSYFITQQGYEYLNEFSNYAFMQPAEEKQFFLATEIPGNGSPVKTLVLNGTENRQIWIQLNSNYTLPVINNNLTETNITN